MEYPGWIPFCKKNIESCIVLQYFPLSIMCLKNPVRYWLPLLTKYFEVFHSDSDSFHNKDFLAGSDPFHNSPKLLSALGNAIQRKTVCGQLFSTQGVRHDGEELRGF